MSVKFWTFLLGLALLAISSCSGRALTDATEDGGESENLLPYNEETSKNHWEAEEWVKVSLAPEPHVDHKLGTQLELECEILGSPPPQVKWIRGPFHADWEDELSSNSISQSSTGGVARVRSRLVLDHVPTVGEHRYTCIGKVGGQVVHASTTVKTSGSEIFPVNVHRHGDPTAMLLDNNGRFGMRESSVAALTAPRITAWYNVLLEKIGNPVILPCEAHAQPHPQVFWMDNNDNLITKHSSRFKVLSNGSLLILNLKWDDMGEFHCVAKNDIGKDTKGTFLYPMLRE